MNKKGFTLIELLGVIIIISLLTILVLPKITDSVRNNSEKTDALMLNMIEDAARLYIEDNIDEFPKNSNNSYCIELNKLIDENYFKKNIQLDGEDVTNTKSIQVTYTDSYNIEFVDSKSCIDYRDLCKPATEDTKTTGNIPQGKFAIGDEYICEVKPNIKYNFFILSVENDKVNLILDRNINNDGTLATAAIAKSNAVNGIYSAVAWISSDDYRDANTDNTNCEFSACNDEGPITAMNFLDMATKNWVNVPNLNEIYEDSIYGIVALKKKARLPKKIEVGETGCNITEYAAGGCPLWMVNYLYNNNYNGEYRVPISDMYGYWFLNSYMLHGKLGEYLWFDGYRNVSDVSLDTNIGIRPVITLPKNYLVN